MTVSLEVHARPQVFQATLKPLGWLVCLGTHKGRSPTLGIPFLKSKRNSVMDFCCQT